MSERTKIEWCDSTFNPWIGCTKVSPACKHCYAEVSTPARTMGITFGPSQARHRTSVHTWREPLRWNKYHHAFKQVHGRRRRVFCASLADVFDNEVPPIWRAELFELIEATPHLDWLLLTKRIGNAWKMMADALGVSQASLKLPLSNVWLGATVVNQAEADRDVLKLLTVPARVRFLSIEPMLGPIDLTNLVVHQGAIAPGEEGPKYWDSLDTEDARLLLDATRSGSHYLHDRPAVDWVIVGGESGREARPMHPDWVRSLRDQCACADVPFLFKQWGEWTSHQVDPEGAASHLNCIDANGQECALSRNEADRAKGEPWWHLPAWPGRGTWGQDGIPAGVVEIRHTGKKAAGRLLDGVEHNGFPEVRHATA